MTIELISNKQKGQPAWCCSICKKQFQTKAIAETHHRRKHEGKK